MLRSNENFQAAFRMERLKIILLSVFGIVLIAVSLLYFGFSASRPYIGADLALGQRGWAVQAVDSTGLAASAGIDAGDRPVEINGEIAEAYLNKYQSAGTLWGPLIKEITVVDDRGQLKSVSVSGSSQPIGSGIELVLRFVACLPIWVIGFYSFLKRPRHVAAILFFLCCMLIGLVLSANLASMRGINLAGFVEVGATTIGPWLLVLFFLVLPEERGPLLNRPLIHLIYFPGLLTLILFPLIGFSEGQPVQWFRSLRLLEYGAGFLAASGVAIYNYFSSRSFRTRQQMKIVLISCLIALIPITIINVLPQAIWGNQNVFQAGFSILFIAFIPVGMGYAIVSKQLMDIDIVIRRGVVYGLVTLVMAAVLSIAIFAILMLRKSIGVGEEILLALAIGGLATALFGPAKANIEVLVDRFLYKDRYDYRQIIQSLSISLNGSRDLVDISRLVVGTAVKSLNLRGGALFVKTESGKFEIGATQGIFNEPAKQLKLLRIISDRNSKYDFPNLASEADPELAFLIPLLAGEKGLGILCLSPKNTRQDFSHNDLFLLRSLTPVASMAVRSGMLVRDVGLRDTFVSIASHELRTPLTSIVGYTDLLLLRDPPEEKRKAWLRTILDNGKRLTSMVDDLLNVTRIQSGGIAPKIERVELGNLLAEKLELAREMTDRHELVTDLHPDLPDVFGDRDKLGQVIGNLLNNAIKYSPLGGKIVLSAFHEPQEFRVVVAIADEGIGISEEDRDSLFTTFHRIQRSETLGIRGSGLGLYIAKEWITAMGGKIWVESRLNEGSTFFVSIPTRNYSRKNEISLTDLEATDIVNKNGS